jgi:hypothetical protein
MALPELADLLLNWHQLELDNFWVDLNCCLQKEHMHTKTWVNMMAGHQSLVHNCILDLMSGRDGKHILMGIQYQVVSVEHEKQKLAKLE